LWGKCSPSTSGRSSTRLCRNQHPKKLLPHNQNYKMDAILFYFGQILTAKGIKAFLSAIILGVSWLIGTIDQVGMALFALVGSDFILGFANAWKTDTLSGVKFRHGISKFLTFWMTIIVGNLLDIIFFHKTNVDFGWRNGFIVYLGVNEALSVCKHLIVLKVPLPEKLIQKLENYKSEMNYGKRKEDHIANS